MGHERIQHLPKSRKWRDIVREISEFSGDPSEAKAIAARTATNVQSRLRAMAADPGVVAAFQFLVSLATFSVSSKHEQGLRRYGLDLGSDPSPLSIATVLRSVVRENRQSGEYASLAEAAAGDAIVDWYAQEQQEGTPLFESIPKAISVWSKAGTGTGFCRLARSFFAHLTTRYLSYFLDREASAAIGNIEVRDRFQSEVRNHIADVSNHAFETAQIAQSFAAGWFNKHAVAQPPEKDAIARFLNVAFGKIREELLREAE